MARVFIKTTNVIVDNSQSEVTTPVLTVQLVINVPIRMLGLWHANLDHTSHLRNRLRVNHALMEHGPWLVMLSAIHCQLDTPMITQIPFPRL